MATLKGRKNKGAEKVTQKEKVDSKQRKLTPHEEKVLKAQRKEFEAYLQSKKECNNKFFNAMLTKLEDNEMLTYNMEQAIRKCMKRDEEQEARKGKKVTLIVKQWWMKKNQISSKAITGTIEAETAKAYLFKGYADLYEYATFCLRCGRMLTEPASIITKFGATCAEKLGVPYASEVLLADKKERQKILTTLKKTLNNQKINTWIPKSQVEEVIEEGDAE